MSNLKKEWFIELDRIAVTSIAAAKTKAGSNEQGIWELPSGKFIALQRGLLVPVGSVLVATRVVPGGRWQQISEKQYEERKDRAMRDEAYGEYV